jgi:hypothetical protein
VQFELEALRVGFSTGILRKIDCFQNLGLAFPGSVGQDVRVEESGKKWNEAE